MSAVNLSSVLIPTDKHHARSRITQSIRQKDRRITYYPSFRRIIVSVGIAGALAIVALGVIHG